jgi:hypothetical protein
MYPLGFVKDPGEKIRDFPLGFPIIDKKKKRLPSFF